MNRTLTLATALGASLATVSFAHAQAKAQAPAAPAAGPSAAAAPAAVPAKIALINFQQVVLASNEGQTVTAAIQKKYEPKKAQLESQAKEVDDLKKQVQALPASTSDEDRTSRLRAIDTKEKALNRDAEDATTSYNTEVQEALGKVAGKIAAVQNQYAQANGYTLLLDVGGQQSAVLWALQTTDVSQAVVDAYNKSSGISAPPPSSPRPATRTPARPAGK